MIISYNEFRLQREGRQIVVTRKGEPVGSFPDWASALAFVYQQTEGETDGPATLSEIA